jgi:hypothetical protein
LIDNATRISEAFSEELARLLLCRSPRASEFEEENDVPEKTGFNRVDDSPSDRSDCPSRSGEKFGWTEMDDHRQVQPPRQSKKIVGAFPQERVAEDRVRVAEHTETQPAALEVARYPPTRS